MENSDQPFGYWNQYMYVGTGIGLTVAIAVFLYYEFRLSRIRQYKEKYDFVNQHEIRYFWYSVIAVLAAGAFMLNTIESAALENPTRWFFVRLFVSLSVVAIGYFIFYSLIRIFYPAKLAKRLHRLRTAPRLSPAGNPMRRLREDEEDMHLEKSMIEEERLQVVNYDVWIDDATGHRHIEKYVAREQAAECPECGFFTLAIVSEEAVQPPKEREHGFVVEHLQCSYCKYKQRREVEVAGTAENVA